jgi:hypothetical protein
MLEFYRARRRVANSPSDQGRLTVVLSPLDDTEKVPAAVELYAYADQPAGGAGVEAMNGPAVWPIELVATELSAPSVPGSVPICAE